MQTDPHSRGAPGYVAQGGILLAIGLAIVALVGWLLGLTRLASFRGDYIPMAPSTALALVALGSAAFAAARWPTKPGAQWFGRAAAALVLLLCLLILLRPALGLDLEEWLYQPSGFLIAAPLGRMSPLTAVALLLAGSSLLALLAGRRPRYDVAAVLAAGAVAIAAVVLMGYWYGTPLLYGATIVPVALPTGLAMFALGSGLLAMIGSRSPLLAALAGPSPRARILRAFLPAVMGLTLVQGWLDVAALPRLGVTNPALAAAVVALLAGAVISGVTWLLAHQIGRAIDRAEAGRKQAEEALRDSEARFRLAFHDTAVGMALVDTRGCFWQVNPALCRMLGYTEKELLGKPFQEITYPDDRPAGADLFRRVLAGEADYLCFEKRYICKDGGLIWVLVSSSIIRDPQGRPRYFVSHMQDITERKRAEEALRRRAEEWAALYATSLDITTSHHLPELLHAIVERAARLLNASNGGLYLCEPERRQVRCVVSYNTPRDFTGVVLKYGEGAAGTVAQTGQPLIIDDYRTWPGRAAVFDAEQPFSAILSVPLIWQGQVTGVIHVLHDTQTRRFTQADLELLTLFAHQAAIAVANARLLEDERAARLEAEAHAAGLRARERHLALLNDITRAVIAKPDLASALQTMADRLGELLDADGSYLVLWDESRQRAIPTAAYGPLRETYPTLSVEPGEVTATESVLRAGRVLAIEDVRHSPFLSQRIAALFPTHSLLCLPLIVGDQKLGAALIAFNQPHVCTQDEIARGEQAASQIALALAKTNLVEALRRRAEDLALLNRIGLAVTSGLELPAVLRALDEQCRQVLPVDCFSVALYDARSGIIRFPLFRDAERDLEMPPQDVRARPGLTAAVILRRQTLYVADTFDPKEVNDLQVVRTDGRPTRSYAGVPLVLRDEVIGVMSMQSYQPNAYTPEQIRLLETIAAQAAIAVENARLYDETRRYAAELEERVAGRTAELQAALQQLETTEQLRRQFITQVSHELRTPLTNIKTSVFLLERGKPEKHSQYIATLKRESEALHILIEDLLNLLALDVGKAQLDLRPVDVGKLIAGLVADRADLVADRGLTLRAEAAADLPLALADAGLLSQAFAHLLAHAADRAARGTEIVLRVAAQRDEQQTWATIALAEAGQTTAHGAGSGLRRAVAEEIVQRHHGKLTFESAIGQGGIFTVWLPAVSANDK
jgi:PAS domain S-box-containing protein